MSMPADENEVYKSFDRERGARLAKLVSTAFGDLFALIAVGMVVAQLLMPPWRTLANLSVLEIFAGGALGYRLAHWLAKKDATLASAALIVGIGGVALVGVQLAQGSLNIIVGALFSMYVLLIALSGVLINATFMFVCVGIYSLVEGLVCRILAGAFSFPVIISWFFASAALCIAALLIVGAQSLYLATLSDLGDLRLAVERAAKLDDLKNQFIRNVNHELRTPIMAWSYCAELLQQAGDTMPAARRREIIDRSVSISKRVRALIESILQVPKLDASADDFTPQAVEVGPLILEALNLIDPVEAGAEERPLELRLAPGAQIWGDTVRLQEIMVNLISNAVKYSAPGSRLIISSEITADEMVEIRVRDFGLGIPPEQNGLLFERFVRLPRDLASNVVGNGLGLYLCRRLITAMHGRIWAESSGVAGEGSTFHVVLPTTADQFSRN